MANKIKTVELKLLNKLTGEVNTYSINPNDPDALAQALIEAKAQKAEIEKFEKQVKDMAIAVMQQNDYKPIEVQKRTFQWVFRAPVRKKYSVATARQFFDDDLLVASGAITVGVGALKKIIAEQVKEGTVEPGTWAQLEATAEVLPSKPFVMLERLK